MTVGYMTSITRITIASSIAWAQVLLSACTYDDTGDEPTHSRVESAINTLVRRDAEDPLLAISAKAPKFAGYYCEAGDLVVALASPSDIETEETIRALIDESTLSSCVSRFNAPHSPELRFTQVKHTFLELRSWRDALSEAFFEADKAQSLDISYVQNRVLLGLNEEDTTHRSFSIDSLIATLPLPADGFEIVQEKPINFHASVTDTFRPAPGGVRIGIYTNGGGTFITNCTFNSATALYIPQYGYYQRGWIVASHCVSPQNSMQSDYVNQASGTGNLVGVEFADPAGWTCGSYQCRYSDAAWVWPLSDSTPQQGAIARTTWWNGSLTIDTVNPRFWVSGARTATVNMQLEKVGQTSGWTTGAVTSTCADFIGAGTNKKMLCQVKANIPGSPGDSGAPVFYWPATGNNVDYVGLHSAGNGTYIYASPWQSIKNELGDLYALP
jgi:hypothetical protein